MRGLIYAVFCLALILSGGACLAAPLGDSSTDTPVLPDPVPSKEVFPPGLATSGTAATSPELDSTSRLGAGNCSALNPCAAVTPALDAITNAAKKKTKVARAQ